MCHDGFGDTKTPLSYPTEAANWQGGQHYDSITFTSLYIFSLPQSILYFLIYSSSTIPLKQRRNSDYLYSASCKINNQQSTSTPPKTTLTPPHLRLPNEAIPNTTPPSRPLTLSISQRKYSKTPRLSHKGDNNIRALH